MSYLIEAAILLAHVASRQKLLSRDWPHNGHSDTDGDSDDAQNPSTLVVAIRRVVVRIGPLFFQ